MDTVEILCHFIKKGEEKSQQELKDVFETLCQTLQQLLPQTKTTGRASSGSHFLIEEKPVTERICCSFCSFVSAVEKLHQFCRVNGNTLQDLKLSSLNLLGVF